MVRREVYNKHKQMQAKKRRLKTEAIPKKEERNESLFDYWQNPKQTAVKL